MNQNVLIKLASYHCSLKYQSGADQSQVWRDSVFNGFKKEGLLDPRLRYRFFSLFKHLDLDYQVLIFFLFPAFCGCTYPVPSSQSRFHSQSCSGKWKLGTWWQRWRWMIGFNAPLKGPLRRMICHNPPGILIVNTAKLLAGISTGMSVAGTPGLACDLRDFIRNWNFFYPIKAETLLRFPTVDVIICHLNFFSFYVY